MCVTVTRSCLTLATRWTVARQAPPSMGFSRQEYWSGLPCSPPGDLPDPGLEPGSSSLQADSLPSEPPGKPHMILYNNIITFLKNPLFLCCPPLPNPKGFVQNMGHACMDLFCTYCSVLGSFHETLCLRETAHHCFSGDASYHLPPFFNGCGFQVLKQWTLFLALCLASAGVDGRQGMLHPLVWVLIAR